MPQDPVAEAQAALRCITFDLLIQQERLAAIHWSLPVPSNLEAMLEDEVAPDPATELSGCIECISDDHLRGTIDALEKASRITARDLEMDFRQRQAKRSRLRLEA